MVTQFPNKVIQVKCILKIKIFLAFHFMYFWKIGQTENKKKEILLYKIVNFYKNTNCFNISLLITIIYCITSILI